MAARLVSLQSLFKRSTAAAAHVALAAGGSQNDPGDENEEVDDAPAPAPAPAASAAADQTVVLASEVKPAIDAARREGYAAATARFAAVMESDAGKANPFMAVFMLTNSDAKAETIIEKLPSATAAPAPQGQQRQALPKIDLTGGKPAGAAPNDDEPNANDGSDGKAFWSGFMAERGITKGGTLAN